jgi:hypothetical protein
MTEAALPADRFAAGELRLDRVFARTWSVLSRNFLTFFAVTAIARLPKHLNGRIDGPDDWPLVLLLIGFGVFLWVVLNTLSQAIVLYGAFQDMRGRPVDMVASVQVGLRRFFPVIGVAVAVTLLGFLGLVAFIVPGVIAFTRWFVAIPVCVVEGRGVFSSLARSALLTKGHRWNIFGLMAVLYVADSIVDSQIDQTLSLVAGGTVALAAHVTWSGIWGAFYAIFAVVTYHDLRVAREGIDTEEIAAVFE